MGLCCEMLNLVVLGKILWFRCWFLVMKIGRGKSVGGWVRHMPMDGLSWWERVERRRCLEAG